MIELTINPKFRDLLAPLTDEEFTQLEASILERGCEQDIAVWFRQIIDGHNRWAICVKHGIDFKILDRSDDFATEDDVIEWIYVNQLGRRNLNPNQKLLYIGELYELRKKKHGGDRGNQFTEVDTKLPSRQIDDLPPGEAPEIDIHNPFISLAEPEIVYDEFSQVAPDANGETSHKVDNETDNDGLDYVLDEQFRPRQPKPAKRTAAKIAREYGVSPRTVERAGKIAQAVDTLPDEDKKTFIAGKMSQTAVLEKAREIADPEFTVEADPTRDEFTAAAARLSKKLHEHFTGILELVRFARIDFADKDQMFELWAPRLSAAEFLFELNDVRKLKSLRVCPDCAGEECVTCHETGYLTGPEYAARPRD